MKTKEIIPNGTKVTCLLAVRAYYSNYGGRPVCIFNPGDEGIVITTAPAVRGHNRDFYVVDFQRNGHTERVGLEKNNIKAI